MRLHRVEKYSYRWLLTGGVAYVCTLTCGCVREVPQVVRGVQRPVPVRLRCPGEHRPNHNDREER